MFVFPLATTGTTGPFVTPTAALPVPVPATTSAPVGATAPFAYTAQRISIEVAGSAVIINDVLVIADATGCVLKPVVTIVNFDDKTALGSSKVVEDAIGDAVAQ